MDYTVYGILQATILEWVVFPSSGELPNPGIEPRSPHCSRTLYQLSHQGSPIYMQVCAYNWGYSAERDGQVSAVGLML